jgi:hypothetical protein
MHEMPDDLNTGSVQIEHRSPSTTQHPNLDKTFFFNCSVLRGTVLCMKPLISGLLLFCSLLSAIGKPGESYVLTGREKSIFGIFQADMKAYPELYEGEDINAYYTEFKAVNDLDSGRKLSKGEELQFPHTQKSRELLEAERMAAERRERAKQAGAPNPEADGVSVFGADQPSTTTPPAVQISEEERRRNARKKAVHNFQHRLLPRWVHDNGLHILDDGGIDPLLATARQMVDEQYAEAIVVHRYPEKGIFIIEFEEPQQTTGIFYFAIKKEAGDTPGFYALEKGLSFFGAGEASVLTEWESGWDASKLGGRDYTDLAGFLNELQGDRLQAAGMD